MRNFAQLAGPIALVLLAALAAPGGARGDEPTPPFVAVDMTVRDDSGVSVLHLVGRAGEAADSVSPASAAGGGDLSATVRPVLQPNGRIRLHYEIKTVEVGRRRATGSANAPTEYPHIRDFEIVDDAVLDDGATLTKPIGSGVSLSLRARKLTHPETATAGNPLPLESRFPRAN